MKTEIIAETIDNGETEVQLTTIGTVYGSDQEGNPVEQNFTEDALKEVAEKQKDDEILVDADHESEKGGPTEAKGWLYGLFVKPGVGLFGKIKWTDIGRKLIENRVFRWLSPSFWIDKETKEPVKMTSAALTNKPSQEGEIQPIINSAPIELNNTETITMEMTKEELVQLIKDTIADLKKEEAVKNVEEQIQNENEVHEDIVENLEEKKEAIESGEVVVNSEPEKTEVSDKSETSKNECSEKKVENECSETKEVSEVSDSSETTTSSEVKNECSTEKVENTDAEKNECGVKTEEKKEEVANEEEVIKIESLNSAPTAFKDVSGKDKWMNLHGKEFFDYLAKHPEIKG